MPIIDNNPSLGFMEKNLDLCPYYCGFEDCEPGHSYGPAVRDHFLIHYILEGTGFFQIGNRTFHLKKGQGFLIQPGIVTYYKADDHTPWVYTWVGFHGLNAENYLKRANLTQENPIFTCEGGNLKSIMAQILETRRLKQTRDTRMTGLLYLFLSELIENLSPFNTALPHENRKDFYIKRALEFITMNYSTQITIEDIAHHIGINRKYLSLLFKEMLHISPQQYLIQYRIHMACQFMKDPVLSLGDIAWSIGYKDRYLFSKMFKKVIGMPPRNFRKKSITPDPLS